MRIKLNKSELAIGACAGLAGAGYLGFWTLLAAPLCALLWALGGSHHKAFRRVGVPCTLGFLLGLTTHSLAVVPVALMMYGVLCIGYGIPDVNDPKGSFLGAFWYRVTGEDGLRADIFTRATVGLLFGLTFLPLVALSSWIHFVQAPGLLVMAFPMLEYLIDGQFEFNI